ncbi:MAG TPA: glycine zipper domain-containing protein [Candidatus Binataceae bacterium]|nr:glycine zipper domain-containing protein [Candidatus Binataceae bacterium]
MQLLKRLIALFFSILIVLAVVGCSGEPLSTREKGTLLGGAAGAGAGALVGSAVGHPGAGAAIGGVGGAAAGYGIGNHMQNEQDQRAYGNGYY